MQFTTLFFTLGPIGESFAPNIGVMSAGRLVSGLGAGASVVVVPIYISEIAPPTEKGFFGSFTQIMINMGIFIAQLLGYFLSKGQLWRIILAAGGVIAIGQFVGLLFAADSPKWQADHDEPRKAKANLKRIRGHNVDIDEEVSGWRPSEHERNEEEQSLLDNEDHMSHHSGSVTKTETVKQDVVGIFQVLYRPEYNRGTIAVVIVMMGQQLCGKTGKFYTGDLKLMFAGINSIVMYGVSLLADLLKSNSALLNVLVSVLNIVATTAFAPLIDILGRRKCLLGSIAGMGVSSVLLAIGIRTSMSAMSAIAVLLFVTSFGFGLGPVPFILSSELVGPEAVGATQSWALAANWIATFVVAQFFPIANVKLGKGNIYFVFAGVAAFFFGFVFWRVPETKGKKDLEEVWGQEPQRSG